jgi:hypothetical protein
VLVVYDIIAGKWWRSHIVYILKYSNPAYQGQWEKWATGRRSRKTDENRSKAESPSAAARPGKLDFHGRVEAFYMGLSRYLA